MDEGSVEKRLRELLKEIDSVPAPQRQKLVVLARQTSDYHKKLKKGVQDLQEMLDYLRVSIKYLLFDLDATRRENTHLRRLLDDRSR